MSLRNQNKTVNEVEGLTIPKSEKIGSIDCSSLPVDFLLVSNI